MEENLPVHSLRRLSSRNWRLFNSLQTQNETLIAWIWILQCVILVPDFSLKKFQCFFLYFLLAFAHLTKQNLLWNMWTTLVVFSLLPKYYHLLQCSLIILYVQLNQGWFCCLFQLSIHFIFQCCVLSEIYILHPIDALLPL